VRNDERLRMKMTVLTLRCPETGKTFEATLADLEATHNPEDEDHLACPACGGWHETDDLEVVGSNVPLAVDRCPYCGCAVRETSEPDVCPDCGATGF
jgi:rubrerythrin